MLLARFSERTGSARRRVTLGLSTRRQSFDGARHLGRRALSPRAAFTHTRHSPGALGNACLDILWHLARKAPALALSSGHATTVRAATQGTAICRELRFLVHHVMGLTAAGNGMERLSSGRAPLGVRAYVLGEAAFSSEPAFSGPLRRCRSSLGTLPGRACSSPRRAARREKNW